MNYLEQSIMIRDGILKNSKLIESIYGYLEGDNLNLVGSGTNWMFYRIGQLIKTQKEEVWIGVNICKHCEPCMPERAMMIYENYAEQVEDSWGGKIIVPRFCIGASYHRVPFLITEDLTVGGQWQILPSIGESRQYRRKDGVMQEIKHDFDDDYLISCDSSCFNKDDLFIFKEENILNL